jgi:hypothetical protein
MRERTGPRRPRKAERRAGGDGVEQDHDAASHPDLFSEGSEQQSEQLEGKRSGEDENVAIETLAVRQTLRDVELDPLFEQVRLEAAHQRAAAGARQHPEHHGRPAVHAAHEPSPRFAPLHSATRSTHASSAAPIR